MDAFLILIPLALLGLILYAPIAISVLRGRVRRLEDDLARLKAKVEPAARERTETTAPRATAPAAVEGLLAARRVAEPAAPLGAAAPAPPVTPPVSPPTPPPVSPPPKVTPPVTAPAYAAAPTALGVAACAAREPAPAVRFAPEKTAPPSRPAINWEQFMGVKLFAWIGGFALFLAVAFFVKYSFDQGWISPTTRVASGYLVGLGLLVGGVLLRRKEYAVTAHALCGTGVVILYAVSFAAHAYYRLIGNATSFALMVLVTAAAFLLAVRLPAMVVAILGLLGGFLTPPLLSTGVDNPLGLFGYIALLDAGLVAVALKRRWHFLVALAALGNVVMQVGWAAKFFTVEKVFIALAIFGVFNALFLAAVEWAKRSGQSNDYVSGPAAALPFVTFAFTFWLLNLADLAARPGVIFAFLLVAELPLLALAWREPRYALAHPAAGAAAFLVLAAWTAARLTPELLNWALAGYLGFAVLHTLFPIVLQRVRPGAAPLWIGHLFPPLALLLVMMPMLQELAVPWLVWPVVLLVDVLAIGLALLTGAALGVLAMVVLTVVVTAVWLAGAPATLVTLPELLIVAGGFAVFFFIVGLGFGERILAKLEAAAGGDISKSAAAGWLNLKGDRTAVLAQVPAFSAVLPFLLLVMAVARLPLVNPTPVFGLALLLVVLLLVLARKPGLDILAPVALACVLALEYVWHGARFTRETAGVTVAWNVGFTVLFAGFPFLFRTAFTQRILPWATSALAGPLHFFLVYRAVKLAWPNDVMGLLPAAFAVPMAVALAVVARGWPAGDSNRLRLLAWFGGSTLFFITLIFPIQLDKQWLTVAWALEGAALLWLFHRVPHPGLRAVGVALLLVAFARLALNPAVFDYHPRSETRIFNWFLYSYGIVTACLLAGARLLALPRDRVRGVQAPPLLYTLGGVLGFLLLNIEIADWFSTGTSLTFQFNASFGQDMTYSLAWGLYAFLLLAVGFKTGRRGARYAGMGLLVATIVKLFLHDLWRLGGLYRIGSLIGLAVVLMVVSFIYQKFFAKRAVLDRGSVPAGAQP
jgi:hypothetical protein